MELRISSPCPVSWESLPGNDRVRHCGQCKLNVYNLAVMSRVEVEAIVRNTKGRLCGRLYVRGDRTATVQDCRGGMLRRRTRAAWAFVAVLVVGGLSWFLRGIEEPDRSIHHPWVKTALDWISPPPQPPPGRMLLGDIVLPTPPTGPTAPN